MTGRIYLLPENADLQALEEVPYDSEKLLQELLAIHPDLLAGEQINSEDPRRWLLITREMAVQGNEDDSPVASRAPPDIFDQALAVGVSRISRCAHLPPGTN